MDNVDVFILFKDGEMTDFKIFSTWEKGYDYLANKIDEVFILEGLKEANQGAIERIKYEYRIKKRHTFPMKIEDTEYLFLYDSETVH